MSNKCKEENIFGDSGIELLFSSFSNLNDTNRHFRLQTLGYTLRASKQSLVSVATARFGSNSNSLLQTLRIQARKNTYKILTLYQDGRIEFNKVFDQYLLLNSC